MNEQIGACSSPHHPIPPWDTCRDNKEFQPSCPQCHSLFGSTPGGRNGAWRGLGMLGSPTGVGSSAHHGVGPLCSTERPCGWKEEMVKLEREGALTRSLLSNGLPEKEKEEHQQWDGDSWVVCHRKPMQESTAVLVPAVSLTSLTPANKPHRPDSSLAPLSLSMSNLMLSPSPE